jgi:hypothetical protein
MNAWRTPLDGHRAMADLNYQQHGRQPAQGARVGKNAGVILSNAAHHAALANAPAVAAASDESLAALGSDGNGIVLNIVQVRGV